VCVCVCVCVCVGVCVCLCVCMKAYFHDNSCVIRLLLCMHPCTHKNTNNANVHAYKARLCMKIIILVNRNARCICCFFTSMYTQEHTKRTCMCIDTCVYEHNNIGKQKSAVYICTQKKTYTYIHTNEQTQIRTHAYEIIKHNYVHMFIVWNGKKNVGRIVGGTLLQAHTHSHIHTFSLPLSLSHTQTHTRTDRVHVCALL